MPRREVPPTASVAKALPGARLFAPAAARNIDPIAELLQQVAPATGRVLEIASGTGQHVTAFAALMPGLTWQPSDIDPARRASINAYVADANLPNILPALGLDATTPGWGAAHAGQDLILLVNLLHLISAAELQILLAETSAALAPGGRFIAYGPFMRGGALTSPGDETFHASLVAQDAEIGYKDDAQVIAWMAEAGLAHVRTVEMPANNLALLATRTPDA